MSNKNRITYRKVTPKDTPFLLELYASTREDVHLYGKQLSRAEQDNFIKSQFELQDKHYRTFNKSTKFQIIQKDLQDIGRLYIEELKDQINIIEMSIISEFRNSEIGSEVISEVLEKARMSQKPVYVHILSQIKAHEIYAELGFEPLEVKGLFTKMVKRPSSKMK